MISIHTQRFGPIERSPQDVIRFPGGIHGFELQQQWLLLGDREHGGLYWLQNVDDSDLSLAVVNPREFVKEFELRAVRGQLRSIWDETEPLVVLSVLTEYQNQLCLNLQNPIAISPSRRLGIQVAGSNQQSLRHILPGETLPLRKAA